MRPSPAAALVAVLLFAGCAGGAPASPADASESARVSSDETGRVEGTVVDDAAQPVSGVTVALLDGPGGEFQRATDDGGAFLFDEVPAGEYGLVAQRLGYQAVARKVLVAAGETSDVRITMVAISVVEKHHQTRTLAGLMGCVITVLVPIDPGYTSYGCGDTAANNNLNPNNRIMLNWTIPAKAVTHVAELYWAPQSAMSDQLRFQIAASLDCSGPVCSVGANYQTKGGPRPVVHWFDETGIKAFGGSPQKVVGRFTGGPVAQTSPVRVILDQKYDVYVSDWFGEAPLEGWTATPPP
ncbi:MAG TPA: carboxypeptidase-like regulatory domain-containing protein [Candidatus Thermoplasmatota archaeon]|nr:carboxypeptidase-like regulatory domain-containing protein [Candidatus Thermoplasmatota archaeon]